MHERQKVAKGQASAEDQAANSKRNARRARQQVRRLCRGNRLQYLNTVTFPGDGEHDYARANLVISRFTRRYGKHLLKRCLSVPELHPGGHGWHWHILTRHRVSATLLRIAWTRHLLRSGYGRPNTPSGLAIIDCTALGGPKWGAIYAAKYVGKTFDQEEELSGVPPGAQRYHASKDLEFPEWAVGPLGNVPGLWAVRSRLEAMGVPFDRAYATSSVAIEDWLGPEFIYVTWEDPP